MSVWPINREWEDVIWGFSCQGLLNWQDLKRPTSRPILSKCAVTISLDPRVQAPRKMEDTDFDFTHSTLRLCLSELLVATKWLLMGFKTQIILAIPNKHHGEKLNLDELQDKQLLVFILNRSEFGYLPCNFNLISYRAQSVVRVIEPIHSDDSVPIQ